MSTYFVGVFAICACLGALGFISYNKKNRAERAAIGVILLYVVLTPVAENIGELRGASFDLDVIKNEYASGGYSEIGEAALCDGICRAVATEFSLSEGDVSVTVRGFDFAEMQGDTVIVLLSGRAALADSRAVRTYVDKLGVGKCEVQIEIGG